MHITIKKWGNSLGIRIPKNFARNLSLKDGSVVEIKENEPLMRNTSRNAPLYRLIFASKHPLGNKFWEQVTNRDIYGQNKLC